MRRIALLCAVLCLCTTAAVAWGHSISVRQAASHVSRKAHVNRHPRTRGSRHKSHPAKHSGAKASSKKTTSKKTSSKKTTPKHATASKAALTTADPVLFGDQTVESSADNNSAGLAEAFPFSGHVDGTARSINLYLDSRNTAKTVMAAIYADRSGHPGSLLAGDTLSSPKAGAWNTLPISATTVSSSKSYWIAVLGKGGKMFFRDRSSGPCESVNSSQTSLASMPSAWNAGAQWSTCPVSAYVSGTATAVITSAPPQSTTTSTTTTATTPTTTSTAAPLPPLPPLAVAPLPLQAPQISGSAMDGQTLTTDNGTWLDGPTSYSYQWEDCNTSGASCSSIAGATGGSYTLTRTDVNDTVRVVVTASNTGGSTPSTSSQTGVVQPMPAPTNTALPAVSGAATQGQTLNTSNGTWTGNPTFTYQWQDCNTSGASCTNISGATGTNYALTANDAGHTIRSVVTGANAGGSAKATSNQTATVASSAPAAPTNTALPTISGTATQGQALTVSNGSWTGNPTFTYQWQDCNTSGASCTNISGATSNSHTLTANEVGDTVRAIVTGTNAGGSASSTSAASATVTSSGGGGGGGTQTLNCFASPGACGYPDPAYGNVGVPAGTTLTASGDLVITKAGTVINGLDISGPAPVVQIEANNVTIENSKITATSGGCGTQNTCGNQIVAISHNGGTFYTGTHLTYDELTTGNATTVEYAIHCACAGGQASTELDHLYVHGVDGALWTYGGGYLHDNYFMAQEFIASDHLEDIYCPGNEVTDLTVVHDTQLNTNNSVASGVFCDTNGGQGGTCSNHITMKNNLLAGGGYAIYACGNASNVGSSKLDFENNDLARCTSTPIGQASDGGFDCQGKTSTAPGAGADSHGYWPYGGHYGVDSYTWCPGTSGQIWSGNFWDDNGAAVDC
jgi:hypothetical protein